MGGEKQEETFGRATQEDPCPLDHEQYLIE